MLSLAAQVFSLETLTVDRLHSADTVQTFWMGTCDDGSFEVWKFMLVFPDFGTVVDVYELNMKITFRDCTRNIVRDAYITG